ncbi:MAG: DNA cytosine methyltransferase [Acidimicrobiales bacterium]
MVVLNGVSLFSNCGAGDLGYRAAGFRFEVLAELEAHRLDVAKLNHPRASGVAGDLRVTLPLVLEEWTRRRGAETPALLAACPPCQGMSTARSGLGVESDAVAGSRDPRNLLVSVVAEAARSLHPRAIVVENVPAFLTRKVLHPDRLTPVSAAALLIERLADEYFVWPAVADLSDFGVPQTRRRSFLTFLRRGEAGVSRLQENRIAPYPLPAGGAPSLSQTLAEMELPPLDAASSSAATDPERPLHRVPVWHGRQYEMVAAIPRDRGASAWENLRCGVCGVVGGDDDIDCPGCGAELLRPIVETDSGRRLVAGFRRTSYSRMDPDRPAATVTTASGRVGSDNTLHPSENRVLSILECQLLQTIPESFNWGDALQRKGHTAVRAMIGEAVPPAFTRQHGRVLASLLEGRRPYSVMPSDDPRILKAVESLRRACADAPEVDRQRLEGALGL